MKRTCTTLFTSLLFLTLWAAIPPTHAQDQVVYYHNDALGSPLVGTDASGAVVWREQYSPYGTRLLHESREVSCTGGSCVPVNSLEDERQWYTGKYEETDLSLVYYGARWYEPRIGRFISPDPVQFHEDNIFSFNRYAYANNNPYRYTDPDGESPIDVVFLAVDVGRLAIAVSSGDMAAAQSAGVDVFFSAVGVVVPVPGVGQALKVANAAGKANDLANAVSLGKSAVQSADNFARNPPNPFGKLGSPRHQAHVEDEVRTMQKTYAGNSDIAVSTEVRVVGYDGKARLLDAQAVDRRTGEIVDQVQVGRSNISGPPVIRERRAMEDIDRATGFDTRYRAYDR